MTPQPIRQTGTRPKGLLAACSLAILSLCGTGPVHAAPIAYDFDDGTLQGWTTVSSDPGNGPLPEAYASVSAQAGINPQGGTKFVMCQPSQNRDSAHKTLWIRSPEFSINQAGNLTLWLAGGTSLGGYPGTSGILPNHESQIPLDSDSTLNGLMGVALRDTATGDFVLTAERPGPSDASWKQVTWDVSAYLNNGKKYTLELFDYHSGNGWSHLSMDSVSIPGVTAPVITGAATAAPFMTVHGTPSASQAFPVSGANLTADITATAPAGLEVSTDGSTYAASAAIPEVDGNAGGTLHIRLAATAPVGTYNSLNIVLSSPGAASVNITTAAGGNVVGNPSSPLITATGTLSAMGTVRGTASTASSFTLSGTNMTTGITVTPPAGLEVSQASGDSGFAGSGTAITVGSSGMIAPTTIYVRLAASAPVGTYNSLNIVLSSTGAESVNVPTTATGNTVVAPPPVITATGSLATVSTTYGTPSVATSFSVSGTDMLDGITITPPDGLEVSQTSATSGFAGNGIPIVVGAAGEIPAATIYVRLSATARVGDYNSLDIVLSSNGATSVHVATTGDGNTVSGVTITYDFDDGTLQGWTTVSGDPGNSPDPENYGSVSAQAGIDPQGGSKFVMCQPSNTRDNPHKPLWIRSPQFIINQSGYLTLWLAGGTSMGGYPGASGQLPTHESQIPLAADSTSSGLMGVALRDTATGDFVLTAERPGPSGAAWKQIVWDVSAYRNNGRTYTIELFDYNSGAAWRFLSLDTVTIPGSTFDSNDLDADGMPDAYEIATVGNTTSLTATGDFDGDGTGDVVEYRLGLIPDNPASMFKVTVTRDPGTGDVILAWPSRNGCSFDVLWSEDMTPGSWVPIGTVSDTTEEGATSTFTDLGSNLVDYPESFYRVSLRP